MAVTAIPGGHYRMTAASDALNAATIGHGGTKPHPVRVQAIELIVGASPATTTTRAGGTSGTILFDAIPVANTSTQIFSPAEPVDIDDLAVSAISANTTVVVFCS